MSLTKEDKKEMGQIVEEKIEKALEKFAMILQKSFLHIENQFQDIESKMATKEDLHNLKIELKADFASKEDLNNWEERLTFRYD